ncbi:MAG: glycoside hydrolase family 172 protein [Bacteroidales bacterium]
MNKLLFFIIGYSLLSCLSCNHDKKETVSIQSLLVEMTSRENLTFFPAKPFFHKQFSSYNRASVSKADSGWFANQDMSHFIRVEQNSGRREFVMLDADGPGAIVRWWMTFYKAQNGTIRIYIDRDSVPALEGRPDSLLSGNQVACYPFSASLQKGAPIGEVGRDYDHNLYFPVPFSKHCKITYECDSLRLLHDYEGTAVPEGYWWPDVFYNIGCRFYKANTPVQSFTLESLEKCRPMIAQAGISLLSDKIELDEEKKFEKKLNAGDSLVLKIERNESAINRLMVNLEAVHQNQALRSTVLKIAFDENQTVWIPAGEFFGCGYSLAPHKTFMNQSDDKGKMESFWVMPFREKCVITLVNYGQETVYVSGIAGIKDYHWKPESMYFGASWHEYYRINSRNERNQPFDINFINIKGKGVYVGDQVSLFNNTYEWWGEGDEKIFVDGESFPSSFGTGSEDYYGYSFARQEPFSHPFLSQPVGIGNMDWGISVNMRHRTLDAIPFNNSISSNIELWHWASIQMNYSLTSYYYVFSPFTINIVPDIESVKHPVSLKKQDFNKTEE